MNLEQTFPAQAQTPSPDNCWAKTTSDGQPGISVRDHCLNVGCVAEALHKALSAPVRPLLPCGATTLAALHDVGKILPGFQRKCSAWLVLQGLADKARQEDWANQQSDHALVSQWTLQKALGSSKLASWAAVAGAHHGRIKGRHVNQLKVGPTGGLIWEAARKKLVDELIAIFGSLPDKCDPPDALLWLIAGLTTVADWIGSDESCFGPAGGQSPQAGQLAEAALDRIGWRPLHFRPNRQFGDLFPGCVPPRPLQSAALEHIRGPGLYLIEAQMGSGKTEAGLAAAYALLSTGQAAGLYFALPTQITSNRIYDRVAAFLCQADMEPDGRRLRLAHSTSWLREEQAPPALRPATPFDEISREHVRIGRSWFASSKRALLAPYGVGTIDQALLGVVATKHFFVRQFGLAGKVVILDEVHTYDLYTGTLVDALIRQLRELNCTVIVLSATLTLARRRELMALAGATPGLLSEAYPLLTACPEQGVPQQIPFPAEAPRPVQVSASCAEENPVAESVIKRAASGQCVLWVRNTVAAAQETFRRLRACMESTISCGCHASEH